MQADSVRAGTDVAAACPHDPAFNIAVTAGHYAQVSGLLAGFAFVAIVFLLGTAASGAGSQDRSRPEAVDGGRSSGAVLVFVAAFFALVICAVAYAILAGDAVQGGRAATQQATIGLSLSFAAVLLFHGISLLMAQAGQVEPATVLVSRVLAGIATPVIAMFYLFTGGLDMETARVAARREAEADFCGDLGPVAVVGPLLVLLLLAVLVVAALVPAGRRTWALRYRDVVPAGVLAATTVLAIGAGWLSTLDPDYLPSRGVVMGLLGVAWALLGVLGTMILWVASPMDNAREVRAMPRGLEPGEEVGDG